MTAGPIKVIIVDDEPLARGRLRRLLLECVGQVPNVVIAELSSGQALLDAADLRDADLLLLDVEMPGQSGLECVTTMRSQGINAAVVFTTAHAEFAVHAFDVSATDYLLKPFRRQRLLEALTKVQGQRLKSAQANTLPQLESVVTVSDLGQVLKIPMADILFFHAQHKFVNLQTREHVYVLSESLLDLEQRFGELLIRIHRSCLVVRQNLTGFEWRQTKGVGRWFANIREWPEPLPVSRRQTSVVKEFRKDQ